MADDLLARLRNSGDDMADDISVAVDLCHESADRIEQLEAEVARLMNALRNISEHASDPWARTFAGTVVQSKKKQNPPG